VNVPRWDDWDVIPFAVAVDEGTAGFADFWMQHNEHRIAAVKAILAPLVLATDFDLRAMMFAGFALQLLAFFFLWSLLRRTLPADPWWCVAAAPVAVSLLMFSPAQEENWLWALTALQWHLCNFAAAAAVWLMAARPRPWLLLGGCFLLTTAGMLSVASGIVLWGVVLAAIVTESAAARRWPSWWLLLAWFAGAVALAGSYFGSFRANPGPSYVAYSLSHPLEVAAFVLVYLGNPIAQGLPLRWVVAAGLAGLAAFLVAVYAVVIRRLWTKEVLPWIWLSMHALLVALATAAGRTRFGIVVATTNRYTTGALFFWIGLVAIAAITLPRLMRESRPRLTRALGAAALVVGLVGIANHARLYRYGYGRFVQIHHDRVVALAEITDYRTASDEAFALLYPPIPARAREYARILDVNGLGPFSPHMVGQRLRRQAVLATTTQVEDGEGALQPPDCTMITGWAWDRRHPDAAVKVDIYDGEVLLTTVPAYWYRGDLAAAGMGRGRHAFFYLPPLRLKDGLTRQIRAFVSGTDRELTGSPSPFTCSDREAVLWR
jgi:hypothetical protein